MLELSVAVGVVGTFARLAVGLQAEVEALQQAADQLLTGDEAPLGQRRGEMALAQADPPQRSLRVTADRRLHQLIQSFQDPRLRLDRGLLSTTPAANPLAASHRPGPEVRQTAAYGASGNSGGPLLDSRGRVVGINTAIIGPSGANVGIGFALPINRAKALLSDYQAGRITERPKLGVQTVYIAGDLADALKLPTRGGLLVQNVERGSSADAAGIRGPRESVLVGNQELYVGGDFIMAMDDQPIDREDTLVRLMNKKRVGDTVQLTLFRNGKTTRLPVNPTSAGRMIS